MLVKKYDEVEKSEVADEGARKTSIRWLVGQDSDAPNFFLRQLEVEAGGHTPFHNHPYEHEVYVLDGKGTLNTNDESIPLEKGSFALVMPGEDHQFENTGDSTFRFLCVIPDTEKK